MEQKTAQLISKRLLPVLAVVLCTAQVKADGILDEVCSMRDSFLRSTKTVCSTIASPFKPFVEVPGKFLGNNLTVRQLQWGKLVFTTLGACIIKNAMAHAQGAKSKALDVADSSFSTLNSFQDGSFHTALENLTTGKMFKDPITVGSTFCALGGNLITLGKINNVSKSSPTVISADAAACGQQHVHNASCGGCCNGK